MFKDLDEIECSHRDELIESATNKGLIRGRELALEQGANLGVKNGSIVAFDVGYWLGLSEGLEKIINASPLPLTEKKLEMLKRNCESIKKATENINLDPTDESINDKLKLIKAKSLRLNSFLGNLTDEVVIKSNTGNIDW